ncbi:MAG: hypothetical protein AAF211_02910, partial [Myxococcota bacterium]
PPASIEPAARPAWSKTQQRARALADELTQLLQRSRTQRERAPHVRRADAPPPEPPRSAEPAEPGGALPSPDAERALATILRDVVTELRHRDLTWLSEDPYG